jgi:Ig-like domain from next to BRCA1 gene
MKHRQLLFLFVIFTLLLSACGSPAPTETPTEEAAPANTVGKVTDYSIKIEQEQGSGDACGADATYFVTATITADGIVAASYEVSSYSAGGQIPTGGNFQDLTNNGLSESVSAGLTFEKAETKTLTWRLTGPYSYPNDINVRLRVNDGEVKSATVDCGSAAASQPTATTAPASAAGCTDSAIYVSDDGKDGTAYAPGATFKKTWKLRNTGTCTWDSNYMIYYVSGSTMTQQPAYLLVPQGVQVAPGADVDVSIDMAAPSTVGDHRADWELRNPGGVSLVSFFLTLKVQDPSSGGGSTTGITAVTPQIVQEQGSGDICKDATTYFVYVDITANGEVSANYRIDLTDASGQVPNGVFDSGSPEETGVLFLRANETQRVSLHVVGPYSYPDTVTVRVYVNDQSMGNVAVVCP